MKVSLGALDGRTQACGHLIQLRVTRTELARFIQGPLRRFGELCVERRRRLKEAVIRSPAAHAQFELLPFARGGM